MRQYSSDKIYLTWAGLDLTPGLAEGGFITIRRNAPSWTNRPDGVGGTIRLYNPDMSGEMDVLINTESAVHQQLLTLAQADRLTRVIQGPMVLKDSNTGESFTLTKAYIQTEPDEIRASSSVDVSWTFSYTQLIHIPAFNNRNVVGS